MNKTTLFQEAIVVEIQKFRPHFRQLEVDYLYYHYQQLLLNWNLKQCPASLTESIENAFFKVEDKFLMNFWFLSLTNNRQS